MSHGSTLSHLWQGTALRPQYQPRPQPHESPLEPELATHACADTWRRQAYADLYALSALRESAEGVLSPQGCHVPQRGVLLTRSTDRTPRRLSTRRMMSLRCLTSRIS